MKQNLTIYFTSDTHGYLSPIDYTTGENEATGLANCISNYIQDGNSLIIDGGDTLQGSPFTYYLHKQTNLGGFVPAQILNAGGYQFVTLGNHDFNYGPEILTSYLEHLQAKCLCANVEGLPHVEKTAIVTLANGLRVGLTGATTSFIPVWEKPENLVGITITNPVPALQDALRVLQEAEVDVTVCIYHGGFENDLETGELLSDTKENQAYEICRDLGFDILLTGHQHIPLADLKVFNTYSCQTADKAIHYAKMDVEVEDGRVSAHSSLCSAGDITNAAAASALRHLDKEVAKWLDTPTGYLDVDLLPEDHITMAKFSLIANFFNQVQLDASGADISCASLGNEVKGFSRNVTIRDVVATYIYPNTLQTLEVDRTALKSVLERSASYFAYDENGNLCVSESFLKPKTEHYNYDFYSGIDATYDLNRPVGDRVTSILYKGKELEEGTKLTICMNNYRSTGTGGYDAYKSCPTVKNQTTEIVELIMEYISNHPLIHVDQHKYLTLIEKGTN